MLAEERCGAGSQVLIGYFPALYAIYCHGVLTDRIFVVLQARAEGHVDSPDSDTVVGRNIFQHGKVIRHAWAVGFLRKRPATGD